METRPRPETHQSVDQTIAIHATRRAARQPGAEIGLELRTGLPDDWLRPVPIGAARLTATLAGKAKMERVDLLTKKAIYDASTRVSLVGSLGRTRIDP